MTMIIGVDIQTLKNKRRHNGGKRRRFECDAFFVIGAVCVCYAKWNTITVRMLYDALYAL
jgi:hypothetical protein